MNLIRKRYIEKATFKTITHHITTGRRYTNHQPYAINVEVGDEVKVCVLSQLGLYRPPEYDIPPEIESFCIKKVLKIYEKLFNEITEFEMDRCSKYLSTKKELALYLALLYNETIEKIMDDYVTIVITD